MRNNKTVRVLEKKKAYYNKYQIRNALCDLFNHHAMLIDGTWYCLKCFIQISKQRIDDDQRE